MTIKLTLTLLVHILIQIRKHKFTDMTCRSAEWAEAHLGRGRGFVPLPLLYKIKLVIIYLNWFVLRIRESNIDMVGELKTRYRLTLASTAHL